ncbi:MAG: SPFH/Band 7/PHB domain protein [Opitutus sp.]|nr:SPFH/Band 7/PHB domain protein [Opitutus sp.]MCS6248725.1 SPFH/Band 7/PHB domain protein [Opitutus sp.]MCS6275619.1 SPFH/Band 7/PHB domain protein [Opitutus sp.]MCS6276787.1 SPFH/Band 7/PHB domain protein [Opitutus sp.]MCS6301564.1 SPFH/Band 7/PHB domain protein [Opitutus sp.]
MSFLSTLILGAIGTFIATPIVLAIGRMFQLWRVLPERTVIVYTFFGKVVGQVDEPGLFLPIMHFGPRALLFPLFGKAYVVSTVIHQAYLRNQLVNSEEGAPMGVGIWFEMFVNNPKAFLFQNSDPIGSLKANVATAIVKQLSNLRLEVLLENRDALSRKVREEVSPTSSQWGFSLGSTYIRKVAFRDKGMIAEIQRKVVNRLRQVTAAMRQAGDNEVAIIHSEADRQAAQRLGQAQAVRPQVVGRALAEIQRVPEVADALFALLDVQATLRSPGKLTLASGDGTGLLLNS